MSDRLIGNTATSRIIATIPINGKTVAIIKIIRSEQLLFLDNSLSLDNSTFLGN